MKVLVIGDVHTRWGRLNTIINKRRPDVVIQVGDFGYWPGEHYFNKRKWNRYWDPSFIKTPVPLYFCDGNHENHPKLIEATKDNNEIAPNVFYQKRGSVLVLGGIRILFMGGAFSIDKAWRVPGKDWFPEETISQTDVYNLPETDIDMVVSHTGPNEFIQGLDTIKEQGQYKDCSTDALTYILNKYEPKRWFFGHFHVFKQGSFGGCEWTAMDMLGPGRSGSWYEFII